MFVSRKYLALIHFIARKVAAGLHVTEPAHKSIECRSTASTGSIHLQPFPKSGIQGLALRFSHKPRLLDQGLVGAEGDVFHTSTVYTIFVCFSSIVRRFKTSVARLAI